MTSIFRQAFLNTSGGGQSSFGGGFSRTLSIPSGERFTGHSPVPVHVPLPPQIPTISTPKVETTSLTAGEDYQGNGMTTISNLRAQASQFVTEKYPNHSSEEKEKLIEASVAFHTQEIENHLDHRRGFAKLALPLPEGTHWENIKFYLVEYDEKNPENSRIEIFLSGKQIKFLTISDMGLVDFVTKTISRSGEILLLICVGRKFSWEDNEQASSKFRKAKERFVEEMCEFLQIEGEPLMLGNKKYNPQFDFGAKETARIKFQDKSFNNLF